ncbi:MAG: glycosyltransferase, partial [Acidimicrobiales bacterium]
EAPPVVAVVVAADPGEHFAEMLASLGGQDYENLSVLVIDAGSAEPIADRVADVLPDAYLHRLTGDPGWSVAANQSIELVSGSPFLLFCHDDVVLGERCVSTLMSQLYRHNAGIAGPKLVAFDDPRRLLQIGMGSDRFGVLVDQVERGEFDQEQYDPIREVFVIPGAVQLIRSDLFVALGGFDPDIGLLGEDLDLCWRAQALGARVLAVSDASARHREAMDERITPRERRKLATRHRLRTVMVANSSRGRFVTVPVAMSLIVLEGLFYLLSGRRGQARDMFSAIGWNLTRLGDIRKRRRALRQIRQRTDREVRAQQIGGSASLNSFSRGQLTAGQDRFSGFIGAIRASFAGDDSSSLRDAAVIAGLLTIVMAFGSRHLLSRGVVPVGQIPLVPSATELFREWWGGWRSTGTGGAGNPPGAFVLLGLGRAVTFWSPGLFDRLVVIGPMIVGAFGMFRLCRPLVSARASAVAAALYAVTPLLNAMLGAGRWNALVIYAGGPFLLGSLFRLSRVSPYGSIDGPMGVRVLARSMPVLSIRYGFLVAVLASFAPAAVVVGVVMALAMLLASPLADGSLRWRPFGLGVLAAVAASVALHGPWAFDVMRQFSWGWLVGPPSPEADVSGLLDLVLFAPGRFGPSVMAVGLVALALMGLALSTTRRLRFSIQLWVISLVFLTLAWLAHRGWLPMALPTDEILLVPVLASWCVLAGFVVAALEQWGDTRRMARRGAMLLAGVALTLATVGAMVRSLAGDWGSPSQNYTAFTGFLADDDNADGRILWLGQPSVVPIDTVRSAGGIPYAMTDGGEPTVIGRWLPGPVGSTDGVGHHLELATAGETVRLGRLLAPYGIDYVVVMDQLAPEPYDGPKVPPDPQLMAALEQQLDLERVSGMPNLIVFRNAAAAGSVATLPSSAAAEAVTPAQQMAVDLSTGAPVEGEQTAPGAWVVTTSGGNPVLVATPSADLEMHGSDAALISGFDGLTVIPATVNGTVELEHPTPLGRRIGQLGQFVLVGLGAILAQTRREVVAE